MECDSDSEMPTAGPSNGGKVSLVVEYLLHFAYLLPLVSGQEEVRGEEVERGGAVGLGHRSGQLRHLPQPHHGPVHRVSGKPGRQRLLK